MGGVVIMGKTNADYNSFLNNILTNFYEPLWVEADGWFLAPDEDYGRRPITALNLCFVGTIAIQAAKGLASETNKARACTLADKFTVSPGCIPDDRSGRAGATWAQAMNAWPDPSNGKYYYSYKPHLSNDQMVAEALYFAYKYRIQLGLNATVSTRIYNILTTATTWNEQIVGAVDYVNGNAMGPIHDPSLDFRYSANGLFNTSNQTLIRWGINRVLYNKLVSNDSDVDAVITQHLEMFHTYINQLYPGIGAGNLYKGYGLNPDFSWYYTPGMVSPSLEYGAMMFGGLLWWGELKPIVQAYLDANPTCLPMLKAYGRHVLGLFQLDGYYNWQTGWGESRQYSSDYWMWGIRGLSAIAKWGDNQYPEMSNYAKHMFDASLDTWDRMDEYAGDPANDGSIAAVHGVVKPDPFVNFAGSFTVTKMSATSRRMYEAAIAIEFDLQDIEAVEPRNVWTWGWANHPDTSSYPFNYMRNMTLTVATRHYSASVNAFGKAQWSFGNPEGTDYTGAQRQNWTISSIQTPSNRLLTGSGGLGQESFSCQLTVGAELLHSDKTVPVQIVMVDGVRQDRTDWDTSNIVPSFNNDILVHHYSESANYRMIGKARFYNKYVSSTHDVKCIGTAGSGSVVISIPTITGGVVTYVMADGTTTTIYAGSTITPINRLIDCKYIHIAYAGVEAGLLIVPHNIVGGAGASVTMSAAIPNTYHGRQPDQERSLLITLISGATVNAAKLSLDYHVTDGTNPLEIYDSIYGKPGTVRSSNVRGGVVRT